MSNFEESIFVWHLPQKIYTISKTATQLSIHKFVQRIIPNFDWLYLKSKKNPNSSCLSINQQNTNKMHTVLYNNKVVLICDFVLPHALEHILDVLVPWFLIIMNHMCYFDCLNHHRAILELLINPNLATLIVSKVFRFINIVGQSKSQTYGISIRIGIKSNKIYCFWFQFWLRYHMFVI